jgi:hypothetical protein
MGLFPHQFSSSGSEPDIQAALDLVWEILDQMTGELDPSHFEVTHG